MCITINSVTVSNSVTHACTFSIVYLPELRIGFTKENISAPEGVHIVNEVCAKILSGVLGRNPQILLDYVINAPRENLELPEGREDSATCMLICTVVYIDYIYTNMYCMCHGSMVNITVFNAYISANCFHAIYTKSQRHLFIVTTLIGHPHVMIQY